MNNRTYIKISEEDINGESDEVLLDTYGEVDYTDPYLNDNIGIDLFVGEVIEANSIFDDR